MSVKSFALPDLGEGLTESDLVAWRVAVGDTVELNQIIAEVETAKALVEVPSPYAGVVRELHAEPGETLEVGAPLMSFDVGAEEPASPVDDGTVEVDAEAVPAGVGAVGAERAGRPVVGHENGRPVVRGGSAVAAAHAPVDGAIDAAGDHPLEAAEQRHEVLVGRGPKAASAKRPHRRARSGRLAEPVAWARPQQVRSVPGAVVLPSASQDAAGETRERASGVRRRTADAMTRSAAVPQVTEFLTIDVTRSIRLMQRLEETAPYRESRLTVLTVAAKALCLALAATPEANARWDAQTGEIVTPPGVNLGIAVATPRGLMVPNIRDASGLRMPELAAAITALAERARAGRSTPAELTGGTITITNVGVFGVDAGTPLLNPGETAILALGAVARRPWEHKGRVKLRHVMTVSLTFDHRVIDGEQGSRLLRDVGRLLADPALALSSSR